MWSISENLPKIMRSTALAGEVRVHHSRDSARKQWDETLVLAMEGLCRVLVQSHRSRDPRPNGRQGEVLICSTPVRGELQISASILTATGKFSGTWSATQDCSTQSHS